MQAEQFLLFLPFRLDLANERLWRGAQLLPLRPKPFAILRYLVERKTEAQEICAKCGGVLGPRIGARNGTLVSRAL